MISHAQLPNAQLPFDKIDVWHSCKFPLDILGNDVNGQGAYRKVVVAQESLVPGRKVTGSVGNLSSLASY